MPRLTSRWPPTGALAVIALAGIAAFVAAVVASSLLQDDYSWRREYISGLSASDARDRWVMVAGFVAAGFATPPLALALHRTIRPGWAKATGPLMIAAAGAGLIFMGFFENDCSDALQACKEQRDRGASWHSVAHDVISAPTFLCLVVGPIVLARRMLGDPRWRAFGRATLALFPVIAAVMIVDGLEISGGYGGIVQRVHVTLILGWAVAASLLAWRHAARGTRARDGHENNDTRPIRV